MYKISKPRINMHYSYAAAINCNFVKVQLNATSIFLSYPMYSVFYSTRSYYSILKSW